VVADLVARRLRLATPPDQLQRSVIASTVTDSIIEVQAMAPNGRAAVDLANGFADQYLAYRRRAAKRTLSELSRNLEVRSSQLDKRIKELNERLGTFEAAHDDRSAPDRTEVAVRGEGDRLVATREVVASQAAAMRALARLDNAGGGEVITRAAVPARSRAPEATKAAGLALGAILGGVLALLRAQFERPTGRREDVEQMSRLPVVATIPALGEQVRSALQSWTLEPVIRHSPESSAADAYRTLYGILSTQGLGRSIRRLLVTSIRRRVGEAAAANLAIACAEAGLATLAISVDDDQSSLYWLLGVSREGSLAGPLQDDLAWINAVTITETRNLAVLTPAQADEGQAGLKGPRLERVIDEAAAVFDTVLVVAPPIEADPEAASLAEGCDGALLVVAADDLDRDSLVSTSQTLQLATTKQCAVILTEVSDAKVH
jgi:Mrp family chromosome partitioning ATPase